MPDSACECCTPTDQCARCGSCSKIWDEGFDAEGEAFGGWFPHEGCSGATFTDALGLEYLDANGPRCTCAIANRAGEYVGEVISGLCITANKSFCKCCTKTFTEGEWVDDEGCEATNGAIFSHGGGFVVRTICECPFLASTGVVEGTSYLVDCAGSYYCDPPNPDCTDPDP